MNKNTNPWMLMTIFLFGLILGFGTGRIGAGPMMNWQTTGGQSPTIKTGSDITTDTTKIDSTKLVVNPNNSYAGVEKSLDATNHYSLGNKNAKVKVLEFSDYQCPFCYRFFSNTFPQILKDYIATGKIYYSYYNYPLNIHQQAPKAAEAALCAGDQNKYWEYHDLLFENQNMWSGIDNDAPIYSNMAQTLGMDTGKFTQCLSSSKYTDAVSKDTALGDKKGMSGTPTLFINNQKIVGAQDYAVFKKAIDDELAGKTK